MKELEECGRLAKDILKSCDEILAELNERVRGEIRLPHKISELRHKIKEVI